MRSVRARLCYIDLRPPVSSFVSKLTVPFSSRLSTSLSSKELSEMPLPLLAAISSPTLTSLDVSEASFTLRSRRSVVRVVVADLPSSFFSLVLGLSSAIENVGVTAYLGAANKITDPAYIVSPIQSLSLLSFDNWTDATLSSLLSLPSDCCRIHPHH